MNTVALHRYLAEAAGRPAKLGDLDCVRFVSDCLAIGWGRDYSNRLCYDSRRSAVARLRATGGLHAAVTGVLGEEVPIAELGPGDVAWFSDPCIGIILPGCIAVKYRRTILRAPLDSAYTGWRT